MAGKLSVGAFIGGRAVLNFSSDANKTLLEAEYDNFLLDFVNTGTSLSTTRDVIVPLTAGRFWLVRNNSAGGQSIQIIGASGTGVTIPTTDTQLVISDGTNIIAMAPVP